MLILSLASFVMISVSATNDAQLSADKHNEAPEIYDPNTNPIQFDVDSKCLDCICQQETEGCNHDEQCSPDGTICGPFQINMDYFYYCCISLGLDNCDSYSNFRTCATDYNCAARCVGEYVNYFALDCSQDPDCRTYARVHKYGIDGCKISDSIQYGNDVMHCYGGADHNPYVLPCTSDYQCPYSEFSNRGLCNRGACKAEPPNPDPNTWNCQCVGVNQTCNKNDDCCTNICEHSGKCSDGGLNGTVCRTTCNRHPAGNCAPGCECIPLGSFGYCKC